MTLILRDPYNSCNKRYIHGTLSIRDMQGTPKMRERDTHGAPIVREASIGHLYTKDIHWISIREISRGQV